MIEIISHDCADDLISFSGAYLELNECENNLPYGLAFALAKNPLYFGSKSPLLLTILEKNKVIGVVVMTPPYRIILSKFEKRIEESMVLLKRYLKRNDTTITSVVGPETEAQAFSDCWAEDKYEVSSRLVRRMRVFEARKVADVLLSPGKLRLADMEDLSLVARWLAAFSEETSQSADFNRTKSQAVQHIKDQQIYIWDRRGPVSIAKESRPTKNGTTINAVYTPPEHRNQGYATSCVLSLTKKLLSHHYSFCSLFTDLSNPASNSIYSKIGYMPVGDAFEFNLYIGEKNGR